MKFKKVSVNYVDKDNGFLVYFISVPSNLKISSYRISPAKRPLHLFDIEASRAALIEEWCLKEGGA